MATLKYATDYFISYGRISAQDARGHAGLDNKNHNYFVILQLLKIKIKKNKTWGIFKSNTSSIQIPVSKCGQSLHRL